MTVLACVVNISEGRDRAVLSALSDAAGGCLLDLHADVHHHRSVFTLGGPPDQVEPAVKALATAAVGLVDLRRHHQGVHPRIGALDVVPWVHLVPAPVRIRSIPVATAPDSSVNGPTTTLVDGSLEVSVDARDRFARWATDHLHLPVFLYGPERSLPEVRRRAWLTMPPDIGSPDPHPSAGAVAVGARPVLVAYNLWLADADLDGARRIAAALRSPHVRTLALRIGSAVQVSCNLIAPWRYGPAAAFDAVASRAGVTRAELVGLVPRAVLDAIPSERFTELDLSPERTIEARLEKAGLDGGRFGAGPSGRPRRSGS